MDHIAGPVLGILPLEGDPPLKRFRVPVRLIQGRSRVDMTIGIIWLFLSIGVLFWGSFKEGFWAPFYERLGLIALWEILYIGGPVLGILVSGVL